MNNDRGGGMTLALSVSAVERLDDPAAAFADARNWSEYVGVIDNDSEAAASVVAAHDLDVAFEMGDDEDIWIALERVRAATATPRHVYVGTSAEHRRVASQLEWEYVPITEAAGKAGWRLADGGSAAGPLTRLRQAIGGVVRRFGGE